MAKAVRSKAATKKKAGAKPGQRRIVFSEKMFNGICERIAKGELIADICLGPGMPARRTVLAWSNLRDDLRARYMQARSDNYENMAEMIAKVSNTPQIGKVITTEVIGGDEENAKVTVKEEDMLGHRKLQVDSYKWLLSKWDSKRYGDKIQHSGDGGGPLAVNVYIPDNGRDNG